MPSPKVKQAVIFNGPPEPNKFCLKYFSRKCVLNVQYIFENHPESFALFLTVFSILWCHFEATKESLFLNLQSCRIHRKTAKDFAFLF